MKPILGISLGIAVALSTATFAYVHQTSNALGSVKAPELIGGPWLNTKDGKPVTLESRKGKPTLVAFWTFACNNCQANMPPYARLLAKYRSQGVELIGIHTPEIEQERQLDQVKRHITKFNIDYPVLIDNDYANWKRWKIDCWPTVFVLDGNGKVQFSWKGELNWNGGNGEAQVAAVLDRLLKTSQ
ncbi:hypothetical protein BH11ARM1_BH11ARM1_18030 [soil metagenome]